MAHILVGIRVVDLTQDLPGPFCTQLLSDLGAEVIKIEEPGVGDPSRRSKPAMGHFGATFLMLNRGKQSFTLNLKTIEGVQIFRRLVGWSDVVVEGFRPGVAERLGIGYLDIKRDNRKLIYCSITGFGQTGPYASRPGSDINILAHSGLGALTGEPGGKPIPPAFQAADTGGGAMAAAFGIMSALYHRERTGRGQYIDVSMLDGLVAMGQNLFGEHLAGGASGTGTMRRAGANPAYGYYETADGGWLALGAIDKFFWDAFCDRAGRSDLKYLHDDPTPENRRRLKFEIAKLIKTRARDEWSGILGDDICASPVLTMNEAIEDPHLKSREMMVKGPHPDEGEVLQTGFPVKFSEAETKPPGPSPRLGEHTLKILTALGYSRREIEGFRGKGVV